MMKNGNPIWNTVIFSIFYWMIKRGQLIFRENIGESGLLQETKNSVKVEETHELQHEAKEREKIHFSISKVLSKKYVYGH